MNHMEEVARMLGMEIGEEFEINDCRRGPYKITEDGLINVEGEVREKILADLITGESNIIKKPWVPKTGDEVWFVCANSNIVQLVFIHRCVCDIAMLALGWYFPTRDAAESHAPEILEQMRRILAGELRAELVEVKK